MEHHWGADAIARRLGLRNRKAIPRYIEQYALPAYLRADPRNPLRRLYYSNAALIAAWEMARAALFREQLKAELEAKAEIKRGRAIGTYSRSTADLCKRRN
jgi:hypothetical protein